MAGPGPFLCRARIQALHLLGRARVSTIMLQSEIIQVLNEAHARNWFPLLDPWFPVDVRLSAYRRDQHWAVVIEQLVFHQGRIGHECCVTILACFGSDLPFSLESCFSELHVTGDGPSGPL